MTYQIVEANTPSELAGKVNKFLKAGWSCQGGLSVSVYGLSAYLLQAMVRQSENSPALD